MDTGYLGGFCNHLISAAHAGPETWPYRGDDSGLYLRAAGACCRLFTWDGLALVLRGYAVPAQGDDPDPERVAAEVRGHYLEHGDLPVEGLEGSFTLALLDTAARRVLLYRNLIGAGFTYYHAGSDGFLFGSNLADLVDASGVTPRPNRDALPAFFLYRSVPGRDTLFDGFHRLLPGEQVAWDARGLTRRQRHTFATLAEPRRIRHDALERLEDTLGRVLAGCARLRPTAANLLSGGVDSSYLQAVWNRVVPGDDPPASFAISVDHPRSWPDTEYAVSAGRALGTRHTLVPADGPYADYLLDTLAATGEPPNHVQTAYFGHLARAMVARGVVAGICGEGADSMFGLGVANQLHNARLLRTLVPWGPARRAGAAVAGLLRCPRLATTFRLAGGLDDLTDLGHPVNRVAAFADWDAVTSCFGRGLVAEAAAGRRALLDRFAVPDTPLDRLHGAGFLGEAMDSASLWTTLFNRAGADLLCPFLDSRMLRLALNLAPEVRYRFRRPKDLLKRALARQAPPELATRPKLGFGQPIFEWLAPGGQLRPLVDRIGMHDFIEPPMLESVRARPSWFLYSLLCYDLWHKLFIERIRPEHKPQAPARGIAGPVAGAPGLSDTSPKR